MVTITPTEECIRLRIKGGARDPQRTATVVTRWLERKARRENRHINEPSLILRVEHDASIRQTFLFGYADSFPDTMPDWVRTVRIEASEITISE